MTATVVTIQCATPTAGSNGVAKPPAAAAAKPKVAKPTPTYSTKSNAVAGARTLLANKRARVDVDFTVDLRDGRWTWTPLRADAAATEVAAAPPPKSIKDQARELLAQTNESGVPVALARPKPTPKEQELLDMKARMTNSAPPRMPRLKDPKAAPRKAKGAAAPGVGAAAREAILAGLSNEDALARVMKRFPGCKSNIGCVRWYRNKMRKDGTLPAASDYYKQAAPQEKKAAATVTAAAAKVPAKKAGPPAGKRGRKAARR